MMKHKVIVLALATLWVAMQAVAAPARQADDPPHARNVILFVADGAGPASFTMARDYVRDHLGGDGLALDGILVGAVRTRSADSRVTDSAAGATAFAAGVKTYNGAISVDVDRRPVATVLEAAEAKGLATGLVATSRITHATPAAFAAHVEQRNSEAEIAAQELEAGVEVILGGGRRFFVPAAVGGSREDDRNLLDEARARGYEVLLDRTGFDAARRVPVLGLFSDDHMSYEIDRDSLDEPSLAEMTRRAISLLDDDPDGFFLLVEGSRIDHAGHNNDAAAHLHELLAFDEAVAAAVAFAREDGETLVIATSDHETGGLTLGRSVDQTSHYRWEPSVLAGVATSVGPIVDALSAEDVHPAEVMASYAGIEALTETEQLLLAAGLAGDARLDHAVGEVVGRRAMVAWTTGGHTGVDVGLYAFGPGSELLVGNHENTVVGHAVARALGLDLAAVQRMLPQE